jgi:ferritin-like metal-binding protein YciE
MNTTEALFEHQLEDVYFAEHELLDALGDLAEQTENEEIRAAFEEHREETQGHVERLEEVFELVGEPPEKEECEAIQGLIAEHESFLEEDPDQEILDLHNVNAAEKTEHYEIAAYGNLAFLADQLGYDEAADLLGQNLEEEQAALERLKDLTESYDFGQIPA